MKEPSILQLSLVVGGNSENKANQPDLVSYGVAFATGFARGGALGGLSSTSVNLALDLARSLPITIHENSLPSGVKELIPSSLPIKPTFGVPGRTNNNQSGSNYDCGDGTDYQG
ncbi:hypothetical protein [Mannheimia haemolytica]|uniref:hypothetical protein n=1 Tax=Mannheimia haemolytica TaxID=75985 RepID=UPI001EFF4C1D|nr:hypothetical protein [Mannheimia haemolytica]ULX36117.1 hypothetical protein H1D04_00335 [Mannheimia haemolytica]ULX40593.1 hypothetical protein H1D02_02355 [Mannheimia haemolytica]ULX48172.1 hypothetical protein H1C99_09540 [Mannheimia haemolytica]